MYTLAEFCAGTGAFSLGFENHDVKTIFANDFDINSKKIFDDNFDLKLTLKDIHDLNMDEIPKMNILTSGFPCQPFSIAGNKNGFNDQRANVFFKLIEIINYHKPDCVIFENVKNLKTHNENKSFETIKDNIIKIGYTFKYDILNTCKLTNIPHNRERMYIVCFKNNYQTEQFEFPSECDEMIELRDLLSNQINEKYYYTDKLKVFNTINENITKHINTNTIYQYRRHYIRENKNNLCPTLTANMGGGGHNVPLLKDDIGIRKLTPRECFRLQGFPESYKLSSKMSDSALYKLAGNAVTVDVIKKLSENVIKTLNN